MVPFLPTSSSVNSKLHNTTTAKLNLVSFLKKSQQKYRNICKPFYMGRSAIAVVTVVSPILRNSIHTRRGERMMSNFLILTFFAVLAIGNHPSDGGVVTDFQPEFSKALENVTVPLGRDATFTCMVRSLGGYRVGWVRADSKAILAIHTHVITQNPRVSVSHSDHSMWHLHIKGAKEEDRGAYMCQINTDPMIYHVAYLEIVISPDFIDETSGDVMAPEGGTVKLLCNARGHPTPTITWKRENGQNITLKSPTGVKTQVSTFEGNTLRLHKVSRADMGVFLCLASNGVPPSIMKRIMVSVHFHPAILVPNQLIGAPVNSDVTLECNVESYPKSIHFWVKDNGTTMIISGDRYEVHEVANKSMFEVKMILIIRRFQKSDAGSYHCNAKNSLGDVDSIIKLHDINVGGEDSKTNQSPGNAFVYDEDEDEFDGEYGGGGKNTKHSNSYYNSNTNRGGTGSIEKGSDSSTRHGKNTVTGSGSGSGSSNFNGKTNINKKQQQLSPTHHLNNKSQRQQGNNNYQTVVVPVLRGEGSGTPGEGVTTTANSAFQIRYHKNVIFFSFSFGFDCVPSLLLLLFLLNVLF